MSLGSFVDGRYSGSYATVDVGITDTGYTLQQESAGKLINQSDAFGQSIIDGIYLGGNCYIVYDSKEFKAGAITPFWPWGAVRRLTDDRQHAAPVGRRYSDVAAATVLTALAGTPYNTSGALAVATLTASLGILAPNNPASLLFTTDLRMVPTRLLLLPSSAGSSTITTTWFIVA